MTKTLNREYKRYFVSEPEYLEAKLDGQTKIWPALNTLQAHQHLQILHDLCSFQLFDTDRFTSLPNFRDAGAEWRISCLGRDKHGTDYWSIANCWLYTESNNEWKCVAWDTSSWRFFLQDNPLKNSRRAADKQILHHLETVIHPAAQEILSEVERMRNARRKKEEAVLQRQIFLETRQRSLRASTREKIHQQLQQERQEDQPTRKSFAAPETAKLTREARMAMRQKNILKREADQLVEELLRQQQEEADRQDELISSSDHMINVIDDEGTSLSPPAKSPIKLLLKVNRDGTLSSDLFIDNQHVHKEKPLHVEKQMGLNDNPTLENTETANHNCYCPQEHIPSEIGETKHVEKSEQKLDLEPSASLSVAQTDFESKKCKSDRDMIKDELDAAELLRGISSTIL